MFNKNFSILDGEKIGRGTVMNLIDLGKILRGEDVQTQGRVIENLSELEEVTNYLKKSGYKVSSTTGVFDLVHCGHGRYLAETRHRGDILIVEVDSDEVVRLRKPDNLHRPIVPLTERLEMLSLMRAVDLMYPLFPGENPIEFIRVMKPDVFVVSETSQDSKEEYLSLIRKHCGEVVILPAQANISTTERIRRMMISGGIEQLSKVKEMIDHMIVAANGFVGTEHQITTAGDGGKK